MKYMRNRRRKAPRSPRSEGSGPWTTSSMKLRKNATNDYTDYTDISTLLNRNYAYRSQLRTSILDFVVTLIYFLIATIMLAENIFHTVLSLLVEALPRLRYCYDRVDGVIGFLEGTRTCSSHRTFQKIRFIKSRSTFLQSRPLRNASGYLGEYKRRRQEFYESTFAVLGPERCPERSKMTNSLDDDVGTSERSLKTTERRNFIGSSLDRKAWKLEEGSNMIDRPVNVGGDRDARFAINYGSRSPEIRGDRDDEDKKSIFTTLESPEYIKLSSTNLNSINTRASDITKMSGSLSDNPDINKSSVTPIATHFKAVLPRPGQDGALYFDKMNIIDFLRRWDIACEDCDISDKKKCARIIDYCSPKVQEIIEVLEGYTESDWEKLQAELKGLFWQYDKQRDSTTSLNQLIKDAPNLDLNIFIVRYSAISEKLVKSGALFSLDRTVRLINSLPDKLREQTIDLCTKENWKLSANDIGIDIPNFDKIKEFILSKAHSMQKRASSGSRTRHR